MPASIFAGSKVKTLKDTLTLNGKSDIISSTVDPTASAVDAPIGSLLINQTSGKLYRKLDAGSSVNWEEVGAGVGGINYILNPSAEVNTTGWATYADAAGTAPVDGSGGSPNVTWTRSTTSPLRGVADFNFAKDAANRQGQGVSYDFTIALADKAKVLSVTFDYEVLSGTYADGDLTVYLIADPAGTPVVIQPAGYTVLSATSGTTMRQRATFQTQATGTSYRLCFHVASTSASAYTLAIDNVVVGPQQTVQGAAISDWVSYTPSWLSSGTQPTIGNGSLTGGYRRVGDSAYYKIKVAFGTTTSAGTGEYRFTLPAGHTIDYNKMNLSAASDDQSIPGNGSVAQPGINRWPVRIANRAGLASNEVALYYWHQNGTTTSGTPIPADNRVTATAPNSWTNTAAFSFEFGPVPIQGWSSNTVMSQDTDTRVVAAAMYGSQSLAQNGVYFSNFSAELDTHGSVQSTKYVIPVSGVYSLSAVVQVDSQINAGGIFFASIYKNATAVVTDRFDVSSAAIASGAGQPITFTPSSLAQCVAGDEIKVYVYQQSGGSRTVGARLSVHRLSGPATIAASETVAMLYTGAPPTGSIGPSLYTVTMGTKVTDSHNAYSSGEYTIPVSGRYSISASVAVSGLRSVGNLTTCSIIIDNVEKYVNYYEAEAAVTGTPAIQTSITSIPLLAGQKVKLGVFTQASTPSYSASANSNYLSIVRVGN